VNRAGTILVRPDANSQNDQDWAAEVLANCVYRWEFERRGKPVTVSVSGPLIVNDVELTLRAASDGVGLSFALEEHAAERIARGELVRVLEDWCPPFGGFFLYYPSRRQQPAAFRRWSRCSESDRGEARTRGGILADAIDGFHAVEDVCRSHSCEPANGVLNRERDPSVPLADAAHFTDARTRSGPWSQACTLCGAQ
jgi:hypothetical protein